MMRRGTIALALGLTTAGWLPPRAVRADVVGIGDITPFRVVDGEEVPDLPRFGNAGEATPLPPIPMIIVGGTDQNVGGTAAGQLTIDIPADTFPLLSVDAIIGGNIFGLGLARVVGLNSQWSIDETLIIGDEGQGFLELIAGGRLNTNSGSSGSPGSGSETDPDLVLGNIAGSQGFVTLDGFGSLMVNSFASIGRESFGDVRVTNRARLETLVSATVGALADVNDNVLGQGYVLVDGLGTRWNIGLIESGSAPTNDMDLILGDEGRGTLEITNQARVRVGHDTILGDEEDSYGEVIVTGRNSQLWTFNDMVIGTVTTAPPPLPPATRVGTGVVNINDYGMVRTDGDTFIAARGTVNLNNGTLLTPLVDNQGGIIRGSGVVDADLVINNGDIRNAASVANLRERLLFTGNVENEDNIESIGGEIEFLGAVINVDGDSEIFGKDAILRFRGGLTNNAGASITLRNSIVEVGNFTNNGNLVILPNGASAAGGSTMAANVTLASTSIFDVTLGDSFSQLLVTGSATMGGVLDLGLAGGYTPQAGDSFSILNAASVVGTFASVISPGALWNVSYNPKSVVVTYAGAAPIGIGADFNGDGIVNGDDLAVWKANFGKGSVAPPALQSEGDANGDGVVDGSDYMILQRKFGGPPAVAAGEGALAVVPEPSSVILAMAALALPVACRRRRSN